MGHNTDHKVLLMFIDVKSAGAKEVKLLGCGELSKFIKSFNGFCSGSVLVVWAEWYLRQGRHVGFVHSDQEEGWAEAGICLFCLL